MCYYCGEAISASPKIVFSETCAVCGKDMHVCAACSFYLPGAHWDCRETVDAQVADKEKRNYCEWFAVDPRYFSKTAGRAKERQAASGGKAGFDALFRS